MSDTCVPIEELGRIAKLPKGHPERAHVDGCTRCLSLVAMLRDFEDPPARAADTGLAQADPKLRATISALASVPDAGLAPAPAPEPVRETRRVDRPAPVPERRRGSFFGSPALAWGFALLLAVGVGGTWLWRTRTATHDTLRAAPGAPGSAATFAAETNRVSPGAVMITWTPVLGATHYRVVFLDATLGVAARSPEVEGTEWALRSDPLPIGLRSGANVGFQVEALAGSDKLATTPVRTVEVP